MFTWLSGEGKGDYGMELVPGLLNQYRKKMFIDTVFNPFFESDSFLYLYPLYLLIFYF